MNRVLGQLVLLFVVALYATSLFADDSASGPKYNLVVWFHDGGKVSFPLDEHPVVMHSDGTLIVLSTESRVEYAHSSVHKFTIEKVSGVASGIVTTECEAQWQCQGDVMMFSDCAPSESVFIYDAQGQLLQQYTIAADGSLQIPLHSFAEGLYIVKTGSITYKFIKK